MAGPGADFVLPSQASLETSRSQILRQLPHSGLGLETLVQHLSHDIIPGLPKSSQSPRYYGFVTGGATPAAAHADHLVTQYDQNLSVHLPRESIATEVEDGALRMLCDLLDLSPEEWTHRTFSTGATASNVLGLALGREWVINTSAASKGKVVSVGEDGLVDAMREAGLETIQILSTMPHSSLKKAAAVVGLGRKCMKDVGRATDPLRFDFELLERALQQPTTASIVAVSCAEINTGFFATDSKDMVELRRLCDRYDAWLHIDAAFGLLARALPRKAEYASISEGVAGFELADSITGDAHKLLNVPYDCGIFLSRHLNSATAVFQNPNAAYLSTPALNGGAVPFPSPLNIGIENSRRFRALPVYATLAAYGKQWYAEMLERHIALSRCIAKCIAESPSYILLPQKTTEIMSSDKRLEQIYMIVLFRAKDDEVNASLVERINSQRKLYVSGTQWEGKPAARFAVANWQVDVKRDLENVQNVLEMALQ